MIIWCSPCLWRACFSRISVKLLSSFYTSSDISTPEPANTADIRGNQRREGSRKRLIFKGSFTGKTKNSTSGKIGEQVGSIRSEQNPVYILVRGFGPVVTFPAYSSSNITNTKKQHYVVSLVVLLVLP